MTMTQVVSVAPGLVWGAMVLLLAGPVGLAAALRERGWTPLRSVRRRLSRRH